MNVLSPPTAANGHAGGDNLDDLLRAFFRAEMPSPWPKAPPTPSRPALRLLPVPAAAPRRPRVLTRSRLALAASVALMLGGAWFLSRTATPHPGHGTTPITTTDPGADRFDGYRRVRPDVTPRVPADTRIETREEIIISPDGARIKVTVGTPDSFPK
jgi:hypothetical protein